MLPPETAWDLIEREISPLPSARLSLDEATGRFLAEELHASGDLPPEDVSAMDGFALAGAFSPGEPLPLDGISAAGHPLGARLAAGRACRIMTGAVVPVGSDRVLPVEKTETRTDGSVVVLEEALEGAHIRRRGEVIRTGAPLLEPGTRITPSVVALLAAHGHVRPLVTRSPTVAILTTGDELVPADEAPAPGGLRDSNGPVLAANLDRLGWTGRRLGIARDDPADLRTKIREGMNDDVLLICGGVSMGERDYVEDVLADLGAHILFEKVAVQPGKPLVAARHDGGWIFGLPGNPASVLVTFHLFVRPTLERLAGRPDGGFWSDAFTVDLAEGLPAGKARDRFLPATLEVRDGHLRARAHSPAGSHDVRTHAIGDGLVRIPKNAAPRGAGKPVEFLSLAEGPTLSASRD